MAYGGGSGDVALYVGHVLYMPRSFVRSFEDYLFASSFAVAFQYDETKCNHRLKVS